MSQQRWGEFIADTVWVAPLLASPWRRLQDGFGGPPHLLMSLFHLGCPLQEIRDKICEHRYQEPVGEDCPEELEKVINQCRAFDPFQRPSAEQIVDLLADLEKRRIQCS